MGRDMRLRTRTTSRGTGRKQRPMLRSGSPHFSRNIYSRTRKDAFRRMRNLPSQKQNVGQDFKFATFHKRSFEVTSVMAKTFAVAARNRSAGSLYTTCVNRNS